MSPALLLSRALRRACSSPQQILVHQNDIFCTSNTKEVSCLKNLMLCFLLLLFTKMKWAQ